MKDKKKIALLGIAAVALAGCATTTTGEESPPQAASAAPIDYGKEYLDVACPTNRLADKWDSVFDGSTASDQVTDEQKEYLKELSANAKASAKALQGIDWPEEIQKDIDALILHDYKLAAQYASNAKEDSAYDWQRTDSKENRQKDNAVARIRLALDLPPGGQGCGKVKGA